MFASGLNSLESGGVLLKSFAPKSAILSSPNEHSSKQMGEMNIHAIQSYLLTLQLLKNSINQTHNTYYKDRIK